MPAKKESKRGIKAEVKHVRDSTINIAGGNVTNISSSGSILESEDDETTAVHTLSPAPLGKSASDAFEYDVFISYSHYNQAWVWQWLLPRLQKAGVKVCIDRACFEPGAPIITEIERAILGSHKTLLILTPAYLKSEWAELENLLTATLDPAARDRRLLPILLEKCDLPLRLRSLSYLDFTDLERGESELARLLSALLPTKAAVEGLDEEHKITKLFPRRDDDDLEEECASWRRQRAEMQVSLRLIEQRMSEYVEATQIPLDLVKRKQQLETQN